VAVILRAAERSAVPWKNGGGLTREIAVHPRGSDLANFDWRVSLAEVHRAGPFSSFAGVDRHMAVLEGQLELSVAGREALSLFPESAPLTFPGDAAAFAEPRQPPVTDLNVMTRRGRFEARLLRCNVHALATVRLEADTTLIVALAPVTVRDARLAALDAARFTASREPLTVEATDGNAVFWLIEIRAM
jgi:environmental stress-induced protein Ves